MIIKFIKRYPVLFLLFFLSVVGSWLINFPLSRIPQIFSYGAALGKYVYDLSIGYITSYLFFYLVVFLKEEKDRKQIEERISLQATFLVIEGYSLCDHVFDNRNLNDTITFPPALPEIHAACLGLDILETKLMLMNNKNATWGYLLKSFRKTSMEYIDKIKTLPYIDSYLYGLLTRIEDSRLFMEAERRIFPTVKTDVYPDCTFLEQPFFNYFQLIEELDKYTVKHFSQFERHTKMKAERRKLYLEPF